MSFRLSDTNSDSTPWFPPTLTTSPLGHRKVLDLAAKLRHGLNGQSHSYSNMKAWECDKFSRRVCSEVLGAKAFCTISEHKVDFPQDPWMVFPAELYLVTFIIRQLYFWLYYFSAKNPQEQIKGISAPNLNPTWAYATKFRTHHIHNPTAEETRRNDINKHIVDYSMVYSVL